MLPLKTILCPTDFSEPSYRALNMAGELARYFGAELCVLHVIPQPPEPGATAPIIQDYVRQDLAPAESQIEGLIARRVPDTVKARALLRYGKVADEIARVATEENAGLIVMATHGLTGWRHLVFGSVAEKTVQIAPCPVLVIHGGVTKSENEPLLPLRKILCPTDYSEPSCAALTRAGELAAHFGAPLGVLHVMPSLAQELGTEMYMAEPGYEQKKLAAAAQKLCKFIAEYTATDVRAYALVRQGQAPDEIIRATVEEKANLLVMSTHGATGWRHLVFGSVANKVLRAAPCPVLVIPARHRTSGPAPVEFQVDLSRVGRGGAPACR